MMRAIERVAFWMLLPLLAPQGLWTRKRAPRFKKATGPREGVVGEGTPFRLLAIGDSIIAGVGVERLVDAMPGQLASEVAALLGRRVEWVARGVSGIDTCGVRQSLVPALPDEEFDCAFVSVGVNDVTGLRTTRHWRRELIGLVDDLLQISPDALIVVSGLPPLHGFPLLPQPLRAVFGMRARTFDRMAEVVVGAHPRAVFAPNRFDPEPGFFAPDGYHPSEKSCRVWANNVASLVAKRM